MKIQNKEVQAKIKFNGSELLKFNLRNWNFKIFWLVYDNGAILWLITHIRFNILTMGHDGDGFIIF